MVSKRFKKWIRRRGERKHDPLDVLLKLYAREENVIKELEECRLNPDFTSVYRKDLEFYLPQLCSYCLYEDVDDEIKKYIILAARSDLYFSHRVLFFLESLNSSDDGINEEIQNILIKLSQKQNNEDSSPLNPYSEKRGDIEIELVINKYKKIEILPEALIQKYRNRIMAKDIMLGSYNYTMGVPTTLKNENGYLSTPFFVFSLTNLCNTILKSENREEALFDGLQKINLHLPAKVYVPFVNGSMRNYVVLHLRVMEAKVFVTKERAPYMVCLEVFRPEENKFKDKIKEEPDEPSSESDQEDENFDIELREKPKNVSK